MSSTDMYPAYTNMSPELILISFISFIVVFVVVRFLANKYFVVRFIDENGEERRMIDPSTKEGLAHVLSYCFLLFLLFIWMGALTFWQFSLLGIIPIIFAIFFSVNFLYRHFKDKN